MVISTPPSRLCLWHAANQIKLVSGTWWGPVWDKGGLFWTVNHIASFPSRILLLSSTPFWSPQRTNCLHLTLSLASSVTWTLCMGLKMSISYLLKRTVVYRHRLFTVHNKPRHSFLASKSFWALVLLSPNFQLPFFFFLNNEYTQKFNSHKIKYLIILSPLNNNALSILLLC